ncbi:MAG: LysM peptidoglycan-binding domain-containing protein [Myxococcales bacterium]|jgi:membrane-bound lytic murein transglycosylase D|nr:MAG: LysM peptidoglycan-binding domain-containing protein [Myxococcales bacterium]
MRVRATFGALTVLAMLFSAPVAGAATEESSTAFVRYPELEPAVAFWREVFTKYTKRQIVFHDPYRLDIVYAVGDISRIVDGNLSDSRKSRAIYDFMTRESQRLGAIVRRVSSATPRDAEERRIAAALQRAGDDLPSASTLAARIRGQRGLGGELCGAVERANVYLPQIRELLAANGVPPGLAALPLVESSYRNTAHSHAGAVGMWQFTRGTGRRFLHIDEVMDERRDPLLAAEAAAKYLRENYDRLGTWPLAITAYNHGANGMAYAVRKLQTKNMATIVKHYQSRSFGFASRNFYAEFLAAQDVMAESDKYCGSQAPTPARPEQVRVEDFTKIDTLAECAGTDTATLMELNPALKPDVAEGRLYVPRAYRLNVPAGTAARFEERYAALPADARLSAQKNYYAIHRVERGQTLSEIASLYRTSVGALKAHNDIRDPRSLRAGQTISVPVAGTAAASTVASRAPGVVASSHRVARGQTLSHIAGRYGVSVVALQRSNGISDPRALRQGQVLRIPTGVDSAPAPVSEGYRIHHVGRGQTLSHIAKLYRTTVRRLQSFNGISDPRKLRYGQVIKVPM